MRQFFKMVKNKESVMGVDDRDYVREERKIAPGKEEVLTGRFSLSYF